MKKVLGIIAMFLFAGALVAAQQAEVLDRIVAHVNDGVVLLSEVDEAVRYEALVEGRPLERVSKHDVRATLERLIDQELLRQQMNGTGAGEVTHDMVHARLLEIRKERGAEKENEWRALLSRYGLDEAAVFERTAEQISILRFLDVRLRPNVHVDVAAVDTYYKETLLPELRNKGITAEPDRRDVDPKIREVLVQKRVDELLTAWLHNLREQSRIEVAEFTDNASANPEISSKTK